MNLSIQTALFHFVCCGVSARSAKGTMQPQVDALLDHDVRQNFHQNYPLLQETSIVFGATEPQSFYCVASCGDQCRCHPRSRPVIQLIRCATFRSISSRTSSRSPHDPTTPPGEVGAAESIYRGSIIGSSLRRRTADRSVRTGQTGSDDNIAASEVDKGVSFPARATVGEKQSDHSI